MLSSISAVDRCSRAAVRAFPMARSALAGRTPSIRSKARRSPAGSTTAIGRIPLLRAVLRCLQDRLGSGLIEGHHLDGLCPDRQAEDRCQYSNANSKFRHGACRVVLRMLAPAFEAPVLVFRRNTSQAR